MSTQTAEEAKRAHEAFVIEHLATLSAELLQWRKKGRLPEDAKLAFLADAMAPGLVDGTDSYQMAEYLVCLMALRRVAGQI